MNKSAPELIALADELSAFLSRSVMNAQAEGFLKHIEEELRTAANQSGSERAGVDVFSLDLSGGHNIIDAGGFDLSAPLSNVTITIRPSEVLATPPAQPALASGDEVERLRDALSLALQYLPAQPSGSDAQKDIARIHDLIAGKAAAWDEAHVSEAPSTHGKPDGAVRQLEREAHPGDHINLLKAVVAFCDTDAIQKITTFVIEQRDAALHPPKIAAADDDVETCIACNTTFVEGDMVYPDASGGCIHVSCCGPEMESYVNADGEPLKEGDPLPTPQRWTRAAAETSPGDVLAMKEVRPLPGELKMIELAVGALHDIASHYTNGSTVQPVLIAKNTLKAISELTFENTAIAAAIDRLDVKAEAKSQEPEAVAVKPLPSELLLYGLADAIGLSATIRRLGGGTIKHEFDRGGIKQLIDALRLRAEGGGEPVAIKPLCWRDHRPDSFPEPAWSAQTPFGFYNIEEVSASDSPAYVVRLHAHHFIADKDSLDEAKAAAQADYEQRIRSVLIYPTTAAIAALIAGER